MTALTDDDVQTWLKESSEALGRAIDALQDLVAFFIKDWGNTYEFAVEQIENARIKDAPRIAAKGTRRGLMNADALLKRCHPKQGRDRFPVHDLLGVRILVRSLNEAGAFRRAVEAFQAGQSEGFPLGNVEDLGLEDFNESPRPSGYRALHIDGSVTVMVGLVQWTVPFEIQVKTIAQHVYGQHTHDEAYVPDLANQDARYDLVKDLQKALAEQLNGADLLLAPLENLAATVRDEITSNQATEELSAASITNAVREMHGLLLKPAQAERYSSRAREAGMESTEMFAALIDPSREGAGGFAEEFQLTWHRRPTIAELIDGLIDELLSRHNAAAEEAELRKLVEPVEEGPEPQIPQESLEPASEPEEQTSGDASDAEQD